MVTPNNSNNNWRKPKKKAEKHRALKGLSLVMTNEDPKSGKVQVLGAIVAPTEEKMKALIQCLHGQKVTIDMTRLQNATLTIKPL